MKKTFFIPSWPAGGAKIPEFGRDKPWLAPLAGYSDLPFRMLCREYGAAVCETEMVSAKGMFYKTPGTGELLLSCPADTPLVVQIFGAEPQVMADAVCMLRKAGYPAIDCNMGCSVRKVMRQKAGAALLGEPDLAMSVARAMLAAAAGGDDSPPVLLGFKLRLGIERGREILPDLALRLEDAGAAWICVHPRYASQGFTGHADWSVLSVLAGRLGIPLVASGDLLSAADGMACLEQTGAAGVMYARGALRDPAIFQKHASLAGGNVPPEATAADLRFMVERHVALARQFRGAGNAFFKMRSLIPRYVRFFPGVGELRKKLCSCSSWEQLENALDEFLNNNLDAGESSCG